VYAVTSCWSLFYIIQLAVSAVVYLEYYELLKCVRKVKVIETYHIVLTLSTQFRNGSAEYYMFCKSRTLHLLVVGTVEFHLTGRWLSGSPFVWIGLAVRVNLSIIVRN